MNIDIKELSKHLSNNEANQITRESICLALVSLMDIKDFEKISISELTRRAGVSRQSFYRKRTQQRMYRQSLSFCRQRESVYR